MSEVNKPTAQTHRADDEIDLGRLFATLFDYNGGLSDVPRRPLL